jgi:hypothetical protein
MKQAMETKPKVHDLGKAIQRMKADKEAITRKLDEEYTSKRAKRAQTNQPAELPTGR